MFHDRAIARRRFTEAEAEAEAEANAEANASATAEVAVHAADTARAAVTRAPRRRLAAAVTAVLAVTAGTALTAAPATAVATTAAPTTAAPAKARDGVISIPRTSRIVGAGQSGFLSADILTGQQKTVFRWTNTATGVTTDLPDRYNGYHVGGSDTVATRENATSRYALHDMSSPGSSPKFIEQTDSRLLWRGIVGRTLAFSSWDEATQKGQLRLIGEGNQVGSDRQVTGLPADFRFQTMEPVSTTQMLVRYFVGGPGTKSSHLAVVDLATASVIEHRELGKAPSDVDAAASGNRLAWVVGTPVGGYELKYADRGGNGSTPAVTLANLGNAGDAHVSLLGDWVAYAPLPYAQNYTSPSERFAFNAVNVVDKTTVKLLDHATSAVSTPDGALLVRGGTLARGEGIYRIALGTNGAPNATLIASTGESTALTLVGKDVPQVAELDKNGGAATLSWTLSRYNAKGSVTLRHVRTGQSKQFTFDFNTPHGTGAVTFRWDGLLPNAQGYGALAPGGDYTWELDATPLNGIGPSLKESGTFKVVRATNMHDYTDNSSPDLLARDASGVLWRDDTVKTPLSSDTYSAERVRIGGGWQVFNQLEAVGDIAGGAAADLVARDASGVLWLYEGKGDGNFAARTKIGGGWGGYSRLTGGSDLDGDGRSDLLATDTAGTLWFYKSTGNASTPFAARVKLGGGWGIYNQLTAVGNITASAAGDLLARDTSGVLWLYEGKGDGNFAARTKIGGGWGAFTHLVGVGDANRDGRGDLYAVGPGGSKLYAGTGDAATPFKPPVTSSVYSDLDAAGFNTVF
ncbi:FG-GAP repeat domain-containing protein [Streptomyces sp. LN699]|uniref:FG-GAP repeat domain-containing protein n=1 Tax=Streptomyces sp. LN699 TaxID=3112981 RepID=UPI003722BB91